MLDHHLQRQMLHTLIKYDTARFADLRPKTVDSNAATYHLQQLVKQGLIEKNDGHYRVTAQGKIAGATVTLTKSEQLAQAHTVFFIAAQNDDGDWLLRKRLFHPMLHKSGFVHGEPIAGTPITDTVRTIFTEKTGLTSSTIVPRGSGYITLRDELGQPESFIHFTLFYAENISGELIEECGNGENYWHSGSFTGDDLIPSMQTLIRKLTASDEHFYIELTYTTNHERN